MPRIHYLHAHLSCGFSSISLFALVVETMHESVTVTRPILSVLGETVTPNRLHKSLMCDAVTTANAGLRSRLQRVDCTRATRFETIWKSMSLFIFFSIPFFPAKRRPRRPFHGLRQRQLTTSTSLIQTASGQTISVLTFTKIALSNITRTIHYSRLTLTITTATHANVHGRGRGRRRRSSSS